MAHIYTVTETETNKIHEFNTIKKAKAFIENWGFENNHTVGDVDIDKKTIMWALNDFKTPILLYQRIFNFNN